MNAPLKRKLLLIDDDPSMHVTFKAIMEIPPPVEITIISALSWGRGLQLAREEAPDVCLLDLNLSDEMRGPQTIEAMGLHLADLLPTLIITGQHEEGEGLSHGNLWKDARAAGAVGFLRKDRYLDVRYREFLLHELSDGMLEFAVRRKRNFRFSPDETPAPAPVLI